MVTIQGNKIIIKTEKDFRDLENKLAQIEMDYPAFVVSTVTTLINIHIIDVIQNKMRQAGVSSKVIDRTYLDTHAEKNGSVIIFHIKSDYISESGFPVATIIEHGRKAYFINQKSKRMTWLKNGIRKWAKRYPEGIGVKIPVKTASNVIFDSIVSGQKVVQEELNKRTKQWITSIVKS